MMDRKITLAALVLLVAALAFGASSALAAEGYTLDWWTVDNGGGTSQSAAVAANQYTLSGTIGQWDAGTVEGGDYALAGGFWNRWIAGVYHFLVYLPLLIK